MKTKQVDFIFSSTNKDGSPCKVVVVKNGVWGDAWVENEDNIKRWYRMNFSDDDILDEINPLSTFTELLHTIGCFYEDVCPDSIVRERVFEELAFRLGVDYEPVFNYWLSEAN